MGIDVIPLLNKENKITAEVAIYSSVMGCVIFQTCVSLQMVYYTFFLLFIEPLLRRGSLQWLVLMCIVLILSTILSICRIYLLNVLYTFHQSQTVLLNVVAMDAAGMQSNTTPSTSGLFGAVMGESCRHRDSQRFISCTWWWSCHKKRDLSAFVLPETNEVMHEVSPRQPLSIASLLQVTHISFPAPPQFTTVKGMHLSRGRHLNHVLHPSSGLECQEFAYLLVCMPLRMHLSLLTRQCGRMDVRDYSRYKGEETIHLQFDSWFYSHLTWNGFFM